jgi:C4-dicarboxylate transporter, DctQ subunit
MKFLDHLEEWFIAFLMAAATLIIFVAVIHRYASGLPIPVVQDFLLRINTSWAQELTIYLFVWMAKFGAAYGVRTGIHVGVDVLINRLNTPLKKKFILFGLLAGASFTGIIAALGADFVFELSGTSSTSEVLELPIWIVYLAITLGSSLMCFRFLQVSWNFARGGELPIHDHAHVEGLVQDAAEGRQ